MLLGEYSIIHKSKALAIPFERFNGAFQKSKDNPDSKIIESNRQLFEYANYLAQNNPAAELGFEIDVKGFIADLNDGLYFESNIPQGYGVGSSGALIANLYDRYANVTDASLIKNQLAWLENYFHGKSSGIDPLVAYLNKPLLFEEDRFTFVDQPQFDQNVFSCLFLIDTQRVSKTAPLVNIYLSKVQKGTLNPNEYAGLVNNAIDSLYISEINRFKSSIRQISTWQLENLREMIPSSVIKTWEQGLEEENWYLKLCGSGGGGFIFAFVVNFEPFNKTSVVQSLPVLKVF
ncbi:MAG: hypothetical protein C0599_18210 [Salinivirgaceae bacterium]|nr:MAG: hypothetical protein C0599_18210 [Salinivirgaceae bacterium]